MADRGCRSHGMLGNQLSKTLTINTPLYRSNHFDMPAATTVIGVLSESLRTRAKKREVVEAKRGAGELGRWREVARERKEERSKEIREAMVRVEADRTGGGGERSEAEMARG